MCLADKFKHKSSVFFFVYYQTYRIYRCSDPDFAALFHTLDNRSRESEREKKKTEEKTGE